jgi:ribosomal protein S18 acetylase RimI-like enzyme
MAVTIVRPVRPDDQLELLGLWRDTWTATYSATLGPDGMAAMLSEFATIEDMLPGDGELGFCAVSGQSLIGSVIVRERGAAAYLWGMYVSPAHHRRGVGASLLAAATGALVTAATVEARVLTSSRRAYSFYTTHGFRETGQETTVLGGLTLDTVVTTMTV